MENQNQELVLMVEQVEALKQAKPFVELIEGIKARKASLSLTELAKAIVEAHNGRIKAYSEDGFSFNIEVIFNQ